MWRPWGSPWIRPAAVSSLRWNDNVAPGSDSASAISPGMRPSGPASTSRRKTESRVACPRAASALVAFFSSMFLEYWNQFEGSNWHDDFRDGQSGARRVGHPRTRQAGRGGLDASPADPDPL